MAVCPLCRTRKARRACPALGQQICAVCCGTKRLVEIPCPADCPYLAAARDHPPAAVLRRQEQDAAFVMRWMQDLSERQSQLFAVISTFLARHQPAELQPLIDEDVAEAATALASTFEIAARGVIYEHRPASLPAERLVAALKPLLAETGRGGGSAFERDSAVVLRRIGQAARESGALAADNRRAFLELLERVTRPAPGSPAEPPDETPRLIVP